MSRESKKPKQEKGDDLLVTYARISRRAIEELRRREASTGATVAAQIRILVDDGLFRKKVMR